MFKKKNICIAILLISNSCTLYLLYTTHQETLSYKENRKYDSLKDEYEDEAAMQEALKQIILSLYKDTFKNCGARISLSERSPSSGTPPHDMACLIAGKLDVIWATLEDVKSYAKQEFNYFKQAAKAECIKEINGLSFRPEGEKKALMLAKYLLLNKLEKKPFNHYLNGLLLGYAITDITFFYQRGSFYNHLQSNVKPKIPISYAAFSPALKQKFDTFVQQTWNKSQQQEFKQEKQEALGWIQEQEQYSIEELYKQIDELKKKEAK